MRSWLFLCVYLFTFTSGSVLGQAVDVYNGGTLIAVGTGAIFSISGSYVDNSGNFVQENHPSLNIPLDAPLWLQGQLLVGGDILNNNSTSAELIFEFEETANPGRVTLNGSGTQLLGGSRNLYFPNLEISKSSGTVVMENHVKVDNNLYLISGNLNLNGYTVTLGNPGLVAEDESTGATIRGYPGSVETSAATFSISSSNNSPNYKGLGLGYEVSSQNFSSVRFYRYHGPDNYPVADGRSILRLYRAQTSTTDTFDRLFFHYFDDELNGLAEATLSLYVSNDNGTSWIRMISSVNASSNVLTAFFPTLAAGSGNLFALSVSTCVVPGNFPDATIVSGNAEQINTSTSPPSMDICDGRALQIAVPYAASNYYQWTTPVGFSLSHAPPLGHVVINSNEGNYDVYVRNVRGCERTSRLVVDVRAIPDPSFSISPEPASNPICYGEELSFVDTSTTSDLTAIASWSWDFGSATSGLSTTTYTYPSTGTQIARLVVTSAFGCVSDVTERVIEIETLPVPDFDITHAGVTITEICEDLPVAFENYSTYTPRPNGSNSVLQFEWTFGDGVGSSNQAEPTYDFPTYSNTPYDVTLLARVTDTQCAAQIVKTLKVNPEPIPFFTPRVDGSSVTEVCAGVDIDFDNTTSMPGGTGVAFAWDFKDGGVSTEASPTRQYGEADIYYVTLTATSTVYGCFESYTLPLTIHPPPTGSFAVTDPDICLDEVAEFVNNSAVEYGTLSYEWNFTDGTTTNESQPVFARSFSTPRLYKVSLTRTSDHGCVNTVFGNVRVHPLPVVAFQHLDACDGSEIEFYNNSVIQFDAIESYEWDFGDDTQSAAVNPLHAYPTFGTYAVELRATSTFGCTSDAVQNVRVFRKPSFSLGASVSACSPEITLNPFNDPGAYIVGGSTYSWTDASGTVIGVQPQLSVTQQGVYRLRIQSPDPERCESTTAVPVFMFQPADLAMNVSACSQATLDAESGLAGEKLKADASSYQWNKDGILFSTEQVVNVTEPGDYEIIITRTKAGVSCTSSDVTRVDIDLPITVTLPAHFARCEGETAILDAGVSAQAYRWLHTDSGLNAGDTQSIEVTNSGTYLLEVSNGGCAETAYTEVNFVPAPSVSFGIEPGNYCTDSAITFTDYSYSSQSPITNIDWNFGDNSTLAGQQQVAKSYTASGNYAVELSVTNQAGCKSTFSRQVTVGLTPVADFSVSPACANEPIAIDNQSSSVGVSFLWQFGDNSESILAQPTKDYTAPGDYDITLSVVSATNGCRADAVRTISILPQPDLNFRETIHTCGTSLLLDAGNVGANFRWFDPSGGSTLSNAQQFLVSSNGSIGLEVVNSFGCSILDVADVILNTSLSVDLGIDREVCDQEVLDAGYFPGGTFLWQDGQTTRTIAALTTAAYAVSVTDQNGCTANSSVSLVVNETPQIDLGDDIAWCEGNTLTLHAGSDPTFSYLWSTGETVPSLNITASGLFSVTVSNHSCAASDEVAVEIHPRPVASFSSDNVCLGNRITFDNRSQVDDGGLHYLWDFGDGTFSTEINPDKVYSSTGSFPVKITAASDTACQSELVASVEILPQPEAQFSVGFACSARQVELGNTTAGSEANTYLWNFGNGDTDTSFEPAYTYNLSGSYLMSLVATNTHGCTDSYFQQIVVGQSPASPNWLAEMSTCDNALVLDAGNAGSTFEWSDTSDARVLTVTGPGEYTVSVTTSDGCTGAWSTSVKFNEGIQPILQPTAEGCGSVLLDPQVEAVSYLWSTGAQTRTVNVFTTNLYTVQVINEDLCVGSASTHVNIYPLPVFDLGLDQSSCAGEQIVLAPEVEVMGDFLWSTGSTESSVQPTVSGEYSLRVTTSAGCVHSDTVALTFHQLPVVPLPPDLTTCGRTTLDAGNPGSRYLWSTGETGQTMIVEQSGDYGLEIVNEAGCNVSATIRAIVLPAPEVELGDDITLCAGEVAQLDAGLAGATYRWSNQTSNRFLLTGSAGQYSVMVTNDVGCSANDHISVFVRPPLTVDLGADRLLCTNGSISLMAGPATGNYSWGSDSGTASTSNVLSVNQPGRYWVSVEDAFQCKAVDTVRVTHTTEAINANFLIPSIVNRGDMVHFAQLTEPVPATSYWDFGDGGLSLEENPVHRYFSEGEFYPTLVVSNGVCSDTLRKVISVRNLRIQSDPMVNYPTLLDVVNASVYPNPTDGACALQVELTTEADVFVNIFSFDGRQLYAGRKRLARGLIEFDISDLSQGVYLLRMTTGARVRFFRLIKTSNGK